MSKKDRMLAHIINNVNWLMTTSTSLEIIPYNELSMSAFNRVKQYIASDVQYSDIVCLISTSILDTGKSGILFTTDYVYSKAWGIFTGKYKNWIFSSFTAEFDAFNEFDTDRMKELMSDLADIALEEDERKQQNDESFETLKNIGKIAGVATLAGGVIAELLAYISDSHVSQNNDCIADEITNLEKNKNTQLDSAMEIYSSYFPLINDFVEIFEQYEQSEEIDKETALNFISSLNSILMELYNQANDYLDLSPDDEKYEFFLQWLKFWALMFYDGDEFQNTYQKSELDDMPELWDAIAKLMDSYLEDSDWDESFSDILFDFGDTIMDNLADLSELIEDSDWDEDIEESIAEILSSNNQAVHTLENALDRATDYLFSVLSNENEE